MRKTPKATIATVALIGGLAVAPALQAQPESGAASQDNMMGQGSEGMMQGQGGMMNMMQQMNRMMENCNAMMERMAQMHGDKPGTPEQAPEKKG